MHYDKLETLEDHVHNHLCCYVIEGHWTKYNMLMDQKDFKILELRNAGKTVEQMCKEEEDLKKQQFINV